MEADLAIGLASDQAHGKTAPQFAACRLRRITRRNRGIALERMVREVNGFTTGWVTYFRHAACKSALGDLDEWLRRKLRCVSSSNANAPNRPSTSS
jgi:hypothetical protein